MDQSTTANKTGSASVPGPQFVTVPLSEPPTESKPTAAPKPAPPEPPATTQSTPAPTTPVLPISPSPSSVSPSTEMFTLGGTDTGQPKKKGGKGLLIGSVITMIVLVVGVFAGSKVVQKQTNPLVNAGCWCVDDGSCGPGEDTIPNIGCDANGNGFGTACCTPDQPPPPPVQGDCASKAGQTGGPCSGQYQFACGGDLCLTECRGGTWYLTGGTCSTPGDIIPPPPPPANSPIPSPPSTGPSPSPVGVCTSGFARCPEGQCSNIYPGDVCTSVGATQCVGSIEVVCTGPLTQFCSLNYWASTGQVCSATGGGGGDQCCIQNDQTVCNSTCNTGSSSIGWDGTCFTNVPGNCFGQVYTCNGNTPGGCSSGGTAGLCFSPEDASMCGKTQQIDIECPGDSDGMSNPPDYFRSKYFNCTTITLKNCNETCANDSECNTGLSCLARPNGNVCWGTVCESPLPPPPSSPPQAPPADTSPPPSTPPGVTAQCIDIRVYQVSGSITDTANWIRLDTTQMAALQSSDTIYISTLGSVSGGTIDRARIRVNSDVWTVTNETNTLKPKAVTTDPDEYYVAYTIPPLTNTFTFGAEIHEAATDRWY